MLCMKGAEGVWGSWHVGETLRVPAGRVVTFQADGDELDVMLEMWEKAGVPVELGCSARELTLG